MESGWTAHGVLWLYDFLKLIEGCHPGDGVDEICQRVALLAQGTDGGSDRVFACRAARDIRVGAVECKIGLIKFTEEISVLPEHLPALFHVGFGFVDLSFGEHFVRSDARLVHLGAEIERGWVVESV